MCNSHTERSQEPFLKQLSKGNKVAGFPQGSDGYILGLQGVIRRADFLSMCVRHTNSKRANGDPQLNLELEMEAELLLDPNQRDTSPS